LRYSSFFETFKIKIIMVQSILRLKSIRTPLIWTFLLGVVLISCGKDSDPPPPPADKVALQATIATAQGLNDNTVEGTKPGQYEVNSKAALTTALNASKAVEADAGATQAAVNNANQQLLAAIADYESHFIKEIAAENLIGFWKMNGNANDSSGNHNDGVVSVGHAFFGAGTPTLTPDRFSRAEMAYHFDKGGNINVPYKASLNSPEMSISLWAKWTSTGRTINTDTYTFVAMNRWNGYKFQLQSGHLPFYTVKVVKGTAVGDTTIYDRDPTSAFPIAENTWRHLVVTFKSGFMSFYIDGDLAYTWDAASSRPVPGNAFTLASPIDFVIGQGSSYK
jgi:hypothetical protein